jgi:hypothetical protein
VISLSVTPLEDGQVSCVTSPCDTPMLALQTSTSPTLPPLDSTSLTPSSQQSEVRLPITVNGCEIKICTSSPSSSTHMDKLTATCLDFYGGSPPFKPPVPEQRVVCSPTNFCNVSSTNARALIYPGSLLEALPSDYLALFAGTHRPRLTETSQRFLPCLIMLICDLVFSSHTALTSEALGPGLTLLEGYW